VSSTLVSGSLSDFLYVVARQIRSVTSVRCTESYLLVEKKRRLQLFVDTNGKIYLLFQPLPKIGAIIDSNVTAKFQAPLVALFPILRSKASGFSG